MTAKEIKKVLDAHLQWLRGEGGERANLVDANLGGASLRGAYLGYANLRDAYLRGANLRGAYLGDANLGGANLGGANLRDANLGDANLGGANLGGANLRDANLRYVYLRDANLVDADLGDANLRDADLGDADLRGADLCGANLRGAYLGYANLRGANLVDANLCHANLVDANLRGANLPAPAAVLLARWYSVGGALTSDLMRWDAANHPSPKAFDAWANGDGPCPYGDVRLERACYFEEKKELWKPGPPKRPLTLMIALLRECCADSDYHKTHLPEESDDD